MKIQVILLLCGLTVIYAFDFDEKYFEPFDEKYYEPLNLAHRWITCDHDKNLNLDVSQMTVHFYDFANGVNEVYPINEAAQKIISRKNLDKQKKFFIYVGGFKSYINNKSAELMRTAFKNFPNSYLIIVDHHAYTHDKDGKMTNYERSVRYVYYIGLQIAQFLVGLNQGSISAKNMHCIGHNLGSHILGHVGDNFSKITKQKIARITALDPAGVCFANSLVEEQIRSGVAEYVEVYHCNCFGFGTTSVLGDTDFYVNKGEYQPICHTPLIPGISDSPKAASCNDNTCIQMWTASVAHHDWYPAFKCDKYEELKSGEGSNNESTIGGFWNPGDKKGVFYLSTEGRLE